MDRREFLKTTTAAAAAASAATATATAATTPKSPAPAAPAVASGVKDLTLAMPWPDDGKGFGDSARRLARRIEAATDRRYRIAFAAAGDEADLGHGTAHDHLPAHPAFAYFAGLPGEMGLAPHDLDHWLVVGGGQMLWDDLAAEQGLKALLCGHSGAAPALWSARPIRSLEDLEREKVFAMGLGADVVRALGAEPVQVPPSRLAEGLGQGTIRAAEWGGALHSMAAGLPTGARHALGTGINANGTALSLTVRLRLWESLSETDKAAFAAAAAEEFRVSLAEARAHEAILRTLLAEAQGVVFAPFPTDIADALSRVADAAVAHVAGCDARSARIDASYMAFKSAMGGSPARRQRTPVA
jgi:TRAP-type mannitol/chloroaromatic compound transport system substrate-binding protein